MSGEIGERSKRKEIEGKRIVVIEKRIRENVLYTTGEKRKESNKRGNRRSKNELKEHRNIKMKETGRLRHWKLRERKKPRKLKSLRKIRPRRRRISAARSRETSLRTSLILT